MRFRHLFLPNALFLAAAAGAGQSHLDAGLKAMRAGDFAEAFCLWKPLAEQGDAEAQYHLGWLYANGNGLRVNPERAVSWWLKAARSGHGDAQFAVGLAAMTGDGMSRDLGEAVQWFAAAAEQGQEDAREMLLRLAGEPAVDLLTAHPDLVTKPWFGWAGRLRGDRVNVRAGPGTNYGVLGQLAKGDEVRVIAQAGEWLRVVAPAGLGEVEKAWIHTDLVRTVGGDEGTSDGG